MKRTLFILLVVVLAGLIPGHTAHAEPMSPCSDVVAPPTPNGVFAEVVPSLNQPPYTAVRHGASGAGMDFEWSVSRWNSYTDHWDYFTSGVGTEYGSYVAQLPTNLYQARVRARRYCAQLSADGKTEVIAKMSFWSPTVEYMIVGWPTMPAP